MRLLGGVFGERGEENGEQLGGEGLGFFDGVLGPSLLSLSLSLSSLLSDPAESDEEYENKLGEEDDDEPDEENSEPDQEVSVTRSTKSTFLGDFGDGVGPVRSITERFRLRGLLGAAAPFV